MIKIAILGATGYTALELIKLLLRHPQVEISRLTSRQEGAPHISSVHPGLTERIDLMLENTEPETLAQEVDCVFSCLPHGASASLIEPILRTDTRVIDLSADYRLDNLDTYTQWYGESHPDADRLGKVPYGLPEWFAAKLPEAQLVANPGCYPTSAILALAPLLKAGLVSNDEIIVDSKSGVSGAGRSPKLTTHYPECNESIAAYSVGKHRHGPEIAQVLSNIAGVPVRVIFTPHLVPMDRGILSTCYARPKMGRITEDELLDVLQKCYEDKPFVRVVKHLPATKHTVHTNFCDISARIVQGRIVLVSCIDNLVKGASGAAVQNMNMMYGYPETTALV